MRHNVVPDLLPLLVDISSLTLMPGNPRIGDVAAIAKSYEQFGQRKPIIARRDGTVIAGNHQLLAADRLGWTHIAVVRVDDDDDTALAYSLADNKVGQLGSYEKDLLAEAILQLQEEASTLIDATGYSDAEVLTLLRHADKIDPHLFSETDLKGGSSQLIQPEVASKQALIVEFDSIEDYKLVMNKLFDIQDAHGIKTHAEALIYALRGI